MTWSNLHVHDHYSHYDGFGTAKQHVKRAVELGQTSLALTNHGNVSGLVEHWQACNDADIRPVLGVEAYFMPKFDKDKERHHMLIFAMNEVGWHNLQSLVTEANRYSFHRYPVMDLSMLKKHHEGLIVTTGCLSGFIPRMVQEGRLKRAHKMAEVLHDIFGDRLYLEVQPYDVGHQLAANQYMLKLEREGFGKCIITADSHYCEPDDYDSYQMMYTVKGSSASADYEFRYMPDEAEMAKRWKDVMKADGQQYLDNAAELADRCDVDLTFPAQIPKLDWGEPSKQKLRKLAVGGLKQKGLTSDAYKARLIREIGVIEGKGFEDYFLLCYDVTSYAHRNGIRVGSGRGSVCGSLLAFAIGLTDVDPLVLGTAFERFLRPDKDAMPDVDMDFDSDRRQEVIDYIAQRFNSRSAQIATFGYYKIANLINDLVKHMDVDADVGKRFKDAVYALDPQEAISREQLLQSTEVKMVAMSHPDLVKHFQKIYGQIRFIGKHAGGVAISDGDIDGVVALQRSRGEIITSYDMNSITALNVLKLDVLGLRTCTILREIEEAAGITREDGVGFDDHEVYTRFAAGDTDGIFQFEKRGAKDVLRKVEPQNIQELIACTSLNRPAPLALGYVGKYRDGKDGEVDTTSLWYDDVKDTFGTIIYQEQVQAICVRLAGMSWSDADYIMKNKRMDQLREKFVEGAFEVSDVPKEEGAALFDKFALYLFNKSHGAGYTLMSYRSMWLRVHHPLEWFWGVIRHADDYAGRTYAGKAVQEGVVFLLPHVNGTVRDEIRTLRGDKVIQRGLERVDKCGPTSANKIVELREKDGPYLSVEDFQARVPKRNANSAVLEELKTVGALEFNQKRYLGRCVKYNAAL